MPNAPAATVMTRVKTTRCALRAAAPLLAVLLLASCGANTPPSQDARLKKAAGVTTVSLIMPGGLWKKTKPPFGAVSNMKPTGLDGERGTRGLVRVTLSGTDVVEYMKHLDGQAHPGKFEEVMDEPEKEAADHVYDALGTVLDTIKPATSSTDPASEVLIDDTLATIAPEWGRSASTASSRPARPPRSPTRSPSTSTPRGYAGSTREVPRRPGSSHEEPGRRCTERENEFRPRPGISTRGTVFLSGSRNMIHDHSRIDAEHFEDLKSRRLTALS
ncbi:hypothetical protein [Streptomyces sp. MJM8645]|uniref:hypothetical protein n=1 Tax=Streptomycetaceae TaxID=2062 RepID=UPI0013311A26|nr:hypothetical protein [Streptomyces sp. MJM8645]